MKMSMPWVVTTTVTEEDSVATATTTAVDTVVITTEATTEVAKTTKCQAKQTNLPTEEITHKEEADKIEEVEVATTQTKEEADKTLVSCRECSVNSVAKKVTEKTSATQKLIVKNARTKNYTHCQKTVMMINSLNMTKTIIMRLMKKFLESSMHSRQKTKSWFS
jgi:hypothetical protein